MGEEKTFENKVKKFIEDVGGWHVKFFANGFTRSGIPDILACINGYFVAIEVKAQNGVFKKDGLQAYHIKKIRKSGGFAFILYPSGFEKFKTIIKDLKNDCFDRNTEIVLK